MNSPRLCTLQVRRLKDGVRPSGFQGFHFFLIFGFSCFFDFFFVFGFSSFFIFLEQGGYCCIFCDSPLAGRPL